METKSYELTKVEEEWQGTSLTDFHKEYYNIFKRGNRNAASHLWSTFLLERGHQMTEKKLQYFFSGFCAVSGSPTRPSQHSRYKMTLPTVNGEKKTGFTYFCCWPCVCDTQDFIRVDTKNITTNEGEKTMSFLVIGNPCDGSKDDIPWQAPEVICNDGELEKAILSDNGYIIISLFFPFDENQKHQDEDIYADHCEQRKQMGYNSGMGEIFRKVAGISPIELRAECNNINKPGK